MFFLGISIADIAFLDIKMKIRNQKQRFIIGL